MIYVSSETFQLNSCKAVKLDKSCYSFYPLSHVKQGVYAWLPFYAKNKTENDIKKKEEGTKRCTLSISELYTNCITS